jgi:hypothetical protein
MTGAHQSLALAGYQAIKDHPAIIRRDERS